MGYTHRDGVKRKGDKIVMDYTHGAVGQVTEQYCELLRINDTSPILSHRATPVLVLQCKYCYKCLSMYVHVHVCMCFLADLFVTPHNEPILYDLAHFLEQKFWNLT